MDRNTSKTEIINSLLKFFVASGIVVAVLVAPNIVQILDKPLNRYYKKLNESDREKEYKRLLGYMKQRGLIDYRPYDFNGIKLTKTGIQRAQKADLETIVIAKPKRWDGRWRLVFFDIPEQHKTARDYLSQKLKAIGFIQMQKSVWIHPFPCREEIAAITEQYQVRKYVTYTETSFIDSQDQLIKTFSSYFN
jgi:DNA-binding transcriptional regulator PaaX